MRRLIIMRVESQWYSLNLDNFEEFNTDIFLMFRRTDQIITFQTSDLIRELYSKNHKTILPNIIDLESFDKQMAQEGKEFKEYKEWKAISFLRHHKVIDSGFDLNSKNFKLFLEYLATMYLNLLEKDNSEKKRFESVEIKVNNLIYERQKKGVRINTAIAEEKCVKIEKEIYRIKNIFQLQYGIFDPENEKQQRFYLDSKKYNVFESSLDAFKARRNEDIICKYFYELIRNKQDLESLLYTISRWGGVQRTYPIYVGFGTITSRIITREPSLQNLRKVNRDVIIPDPGMKLLYVDYSQFEAGILASLCNDDNMIKLYNSDIYKDLAINVLQDESKRDEAKIIFYRYMYGDTTLSTKVRSYFSKFTELEKFRKEVASELSYNGKVGTINGNFRSSKEDVENVWSLSHKVQATASLIYKNALIEVYNNFFSGVDFLIPMHDGTLYQINEIGYDEVQNQIEKIYLEEFKKICPKINPRIKSNELFQ